MRLPAYRTEKYGTVSTAIIVVVIQILHNFRIRFVKHLAYGSKHNCFLYGQLNLLYHHAYCLPNNTGG